MKDLKLGIIAFVAVAAVGFIFAYIGTTAVPAMEKQAQAQKDIIYTTGQTGTRCNIYVYHGTSLDCLEGKIDKLDQRLANIETLLQSQQQKP